MTEPAAAAALAETKDNDPWAECLSSRRATGEVFSRIVTSDTKAKVITVEAGFGQGKSVFMDAWAKHLTNEGEAVIEFDAWKSDHSDDPLMAFAGALMAKMPNDISDELLKKVRAGAWTLGGILAKGAASWVLREGAEDLTEWVSGLSDDEDLSKTLTTLTGEATGDVSSATKKALVAQIVKEHARQKQLPDQLKALCEALQKDQENPKGRVIVMIDELDRCRPDYAIGLLEAIKHLFEVEGFIFVLMVNNDQIERTAAHLYGTTTNTEPYLSKFVDYRLRLPLDDADREDFAKWRAKQIDFTPVNNAPHFSKKSFIESAGELARSSVFSLRQLDRIMLNVDVALKCLEEGKTADAAYLAYLSFDRAAMMYLKNGRGNQPSRFNATSSIIFPSIDFSEIKTFANYGRGPISDSASNNRGKFVQYFDRNIRLRSWDISVLKQEIRKHGEWKARHERLVDGAANLLVESSDPEQTFIEFQ